ncbi:EYS-like protein [Mya arenaria]|uniref:EYS-like protein n=1 Tax=Mya arenaria TaxID=6604 RepID=A0ABY7FZ38_MYAAR|nr:EYS-like protein [Mya arenaria]
MCMLEGRGLKIASHSSTRSSPCKNGGTCSVKSDGSHVCKCYVGFNQSTECGDMDECNMVSDRSPCNNGTCVNTQGSFSCFCNAGYQGKFCRDDVDECLDQSCPICVNTPGSYSCQCTAGYTGPHCQMDVDQCDSSPCRHGSCVNTQ